MNACSLSRAVRIHVKYPLSLHTSTRTITRRPLHRRCLRSMCSYENFLSDRSIWESVRTRYDAALETGAVTKTETNDELFKDAQLNVAFVLRVAASLKLKPSASNNRKVGGIKNPFLNPEEALLVGHLSPTHSLLLNKFNVVAHHVLVVTRCFEEQSQPLTAADFKATLRVLQALPSGGVAFFNCGPLSGASQRHKHIQVVPLPFMSGQPAKLPFEDALLAATKQHGSGVVRVAHSLPFCNVVAKVDSRLGGKELADTLADALATAKSFCPTQDDELSYNVLLSQTFLQLIPRRAESSGNVSVNALGPAGTFFVKSDEHLEYIKNKTPSQVLNDVCFPRPNKCS